MTQSRDKINQAYLEFEAGNYTVAKKRLQSIVDEDVRAHMYLGWLYDQGLGTSEDLEQAEYHYKYLCNLNDINAKYYLAALYQKKGDLQRAIQLYKEAADSGHVSASYWSYAHLSDPSNESRDLEKANIYLRRLHHMDMSTLNAI
jgi:TPR repeat protein